jgi:hypothetical protein
MKLFMAARECEAAGFEKENVVCEVTYYIYFVNRKESKTLFLKQIA